MKETAAIVLAGGRSTRMGSDKASVVLGGQTLLQWVVDAAGQVADRIVVVGAPGRRLPGVSSGAELAMISDLVEGEGPLAGIVAGLEAAGRPIALIAGCDQPFLQSALLRYLAELARTQLAVVPVVDRRPQPLCSALRQEALPTLRALFEEGQRAARVLAELEGARLVPPPEWQALDEDGRSFIGVNTPEELVRAEMLLETFGL